MAQRPDSSKSPKVYFAPFIGPGRQTVTLSLPMKASSLLTALAEALEIRPG